jgi:hypothetical protein
VYGRHPLFSFRFYSSIFLLEHRRDCDWHAVLSSGNFANSAWRTSGPTVPETKFFTALFHFTYFCSQKCSLIFNKNMEKILFSWYQSPALLSTIFTMHFNKLINFKSINVKGGRSQWPRGLRRRSTAARLLRSWVRIPVGAWIFVCCVCCVSSGRGLCDELITRPEESYRLWSIVVCDQETWCCEEAIADAGLQSQR